MKWISEEDLKEHIICDNCDEGCGYIDERDIIDMEWVEGDNFVPLSVIGDVLDKIRAEIMDINVVRDEYSQRQNDYCDGVEFAKRYVLQIIDKYKASPTGAEGSEE